jgi:hypothetical protein
LHVLNLSEALNKAFDLVEDAQTERGRGRNYSKSRQECLEGIFDDLAAAKAARGLAVMESDPHAKEVFESQARLTISKAVEELKSVILTIDQIIELSETNAATKISHAEAINTYLLLNNTMKLRRS